MCILCAVVVWGEIQILLAFDGFVLALDCCLGPGTFFAFENAWAAGGRERKRKSRASDR